MAALGAIGILGFVACIIITIISAIKKTGKAKFWGIGIVACFALIVVAAVNTPQSSNPVSGTASTGLATAGTAPSGSSTVEETSSANNAEETTIVEEPVKESVPKVEFDNVIFVNTFGLTTVYGEVKNNGDQACSFTLRVSFYGADDKLLGSAVGAVNNLNGGSLKLFSAIATEDFSKAVQYKVQVDTMVSTEPNKADVIEFANVILKNNSGFNSIEGEATNKDTNPHSFTVSIGLYDENEKLMNVGVGAINDLTANDTKTFTAMVNGDISEAKSYKVFVDTMVN